MKYVDTNVFVRLLTRDDETKAQAARILFKRLEEGTEYAATSIVVVAEMIYVLTSARGLYRLNREDAATRVVSVIDIPGIVLPEKQVALNALDIYRRHSQLDFEDALIVAEMQATKDAELYSYDRGFDRVEGITRIEP